MFVNPEVARAVQRESLRGLVLGELLINAANGGLTDGFALGECLGANAVVMITVDAESEGFRAVATGKNTREMRKKGFETGSAGEAVSMNHKFCGFLEAIEMSDDAQVFALFYDGKGFAMRTEFGLKSRIKLDMNGLGSRMETMEGVVSFQAYI